MLHPIGRKLYVAMKDQKPIGVFSSEKKAQTARHDSIIEIDPYVLDRSPVSDEYICMISGSCTLLLRKGDSFFTEYIDVGPFWGVNPQSAAACLGGLGGRSVQCRQLRLFRIDQEYAPGKPNSLHQNELFSDLIQDFARNELCDDESITTDYIALRRRRNREAREENAKANLPELQLITDCLMKRAIQCATSGDRVIRCGTPLPRIKTRLSYDLFREFSIEELKQLAVLLNLIDPPEDFSLSDEEIVALLDRVRPHLPRIDFLVSSRTLSKKLQDFLD